MTGTSSYCEHCGKPLVEGVAFCESCGAAVPDAVVPTAEAPPTPAASVVAPAATTEVGHGSPRWVPVGIGILGVLIVTASIVSAL